MDMTATATMRFASHNRRTLCVIFGTGQRRNGMHELRKYQDDNGKWWVTNDSLLHYAAINE